MTWLIGQFHGVMKPHTPTGSLTILVEPRTSSNSKPFSTPRVCMMCAIPTGACAALASHFGAPISWETVSASSPMRSW